MNMVWLRNLLFVFMLETGFSVDTFLLGVSALKESWALLVPISQLATAVMTAASMCTCLPLLCIFPLLQLEQTETLPKLHLALH